MFFLRKKNSDLAEIEEEYRAARCELRKIGTYYYNRFLMERTAESRVLGYCTQIYTSAPGYRDDEIESAKQRIGVYYYQKYLLEGTADPDVSGYCQQVRRHYDNATALSEIA